MDFFPFSFKFEHHVSSFVMDYMKKISTPTTTVAFHKDLPSDLVQTINEELSVYGLPLLANINAWKKHPGEVQVMHVDVYPWDFYQNKSSKFTPNKAAFNIPISNTQGSKMVWYNGEHQIKETKIVTPTGTKAVYFGVEWRDSFQESSSLELLTSYFVRTDKPHRVFANPTDTRIIGSLRLQGNPSIETIYNRLYTKKEPHGSQ